VNLSGIEKVLDKVLEGATIVASVKKLTKGCSNPITESGIEIVLDFILEGATIEFQ
jgi:hypothetical protein